MEWVGTDYGRKRRPYTRRPHLYRDGDVRSVCGRAQRLGMNTKVLSDLSMWRLCAICEVIERTHGAGPLEGPLLSRAELPEDVDRLRWLLGNAIRVDFHVVRIRGRDTAGVRVVEVVDGTASAADVAYLVAMVGHDAEGVRFATKEEP